MTPFGELARSIVERLIADCADAAERKERIMVARENGVLTAAEAADWLAILEVQAA